MKKILITGSSGLLGGNLAYLLKDNFEIYGVDLISLNVDWVNQHMLDISQRDTLHKLILQVKPDVIIHCMAMVNMDLCEQDEKMAFKLNFSVTESICEMASEVEAKVIYISTDAVFDGTKDGLYLESDITNPISVYGKTKLCGEQFALQYNNNLVLRTNIFGYNILNKVSLGEWIINELISDKTIKMFTDVIYSPIIVNYLACIIKSCIANNLSGLYHACSTGSISKYDFGVYVKKVFKITSGNIEKSSVDHFSFVAPRTKNMSMNNQKLTDAIGKCIPNSMESVELFHKLYEEKYNSILKSFI